MSLIRKIFAGEPATKKASFSNFHSFITQNAPVVFYNYNKEDFIKKGYSSNAEVYKIIRKIVDKAAIAVPYLYVEKPDKGGKYSKFKKYKFSNNPTDHAKKSLYIAKSLEYAPDDSTLAELIRQPNEHQTFKDLIELMRIYYFAQGEAFLVRNTEINSNIAISLEVLPANRMKHRFDIHDNQIIGWELDLGKGLKRNLDVEDVFHLKMANPLYDENGEHLRGMSPLVAGLKYLKLDDVAIEGWVKSMQNEGAKGIISPNHADPKLWLSPEQVATTETKVQEKIHGYENKNKIVVSGMPLQYTQIGMSPDALNIIEGMREAQINLCDLWGVPSVLFQPDPTYQNQKEASKRFFNEVILPYLNKEEDALNKWLVEPFRERDGKEYLLDFDTSMYDELKPTLEEIQALATILTKNEMRIIQGYDSLETSAADLVFIPSGSVPLNDFEV